MMMKRVASFVLFGIGAAALGGCPIYPDDAGYNRVCISGDCYDCPDPYYSSACNAHSCIDSYDCPAGSTCGTDRRCHLSDALPPSGAGSPCTKPSDCAAGNCGADNRCHTGDCSTTGCPSSYVCKLSGGAAQCVPVGGGSGGGTSTCKSDQDCPTPAGSKCLSGTCAAPQDQCADATQCAAGSQCVQGACTPSCGTSKPCPTGFACDTDKGVCTGSAGSCTDSSQCTGGTVCVEQHCVAECGVGGTCETSLVCVDGGCTPDERPVFTCNVDGKQDACLTGSICLRHSCYIACDADAGADACRNADKFNVCKSVTTSSGPHLVCGSSTNLGTECDPTQNKNCASPLVCIDGFCR